MLRAAFALVWTVLFALGSAGSATAADSAEALARDQVNPFAKNYLSIEIARNYPVSFAQNRYEPGEYQPVVAYRHNLDSTWMMGVGGQFKILRRIDIPNEEESSRVLALWTMTHEALYILRLDHPTYLFIGPKLHYFLPARSGRLPLVRDDDVRTEIGAAASMTLARVLADGGIITLRADRWRGTRTLQLHGIEVAFGYSKPLR